MLSIFLGFICVILFLYASTKSITSYQYKRQAQKYKTERDILEGVLKQVSQEIINEKHKK